MNIVDRINPVMLKELRQMVRNRSIVFSIVAFLAVLFIASVICLTVVQSSTAGKSLSAGGVALHGIVLFVTGLLVSLAIPFMVMNRIAVEFKKENIDLQYTTLLPPRAFVDGKALCGVLLSAVIVLAGLPFMMLAYLLRGVDMLSIVLGAAGEICASVMFCYFAVGIGAAKINIVLKRFFFIFFAYGLCSSLFSLLAVFSFSSAMRGSHSFFFSDLSLGGIIASFLFYGSIIFLLRAGTVMLMTPMNFNRNRPLKFAWLLVWAVSLAFTLIMGAIKKESFFLFIWGGFITLLMWVFLFLPYVSGVGMYSRRVRSEISPNRFRRFFQFFFFDGGEGGVCFCLVMFVLTMLALLPGFRLSTLGGELDVEDYNKGLLGFAAIAGYFFSVPLFVRPPCLYIGKLAKPLLIRALSAVILALLSVLPMLLSIPQFSAGEDEKAFFKTVGNIPGVIYGLGENTSLLLWHFVTAMVLLLLGFALTIPNIRKSIRQFVPTSAK